MNDQPSIDSLALVLSSNHRWNDLVEGDFDDGEVLIEIQSKGQVCARQLAGNGDRFAAKLLQGYGAACDDHRAVAIAHTRTTSAKDVFVVQVCVRVYADGRKLQLRGKRAAIECFDIDELVRELIIARFYLVVGERVKHERVVRIGAVPNTDQLLGRGQNRGSSWRLQNNRMIER